MALALGIILAALVLHVGWVVYGTKIFGLSPEARAQGESGQCPNPRPVNTFTGNGPQETPPFQINTTSFRVSYDAQGSSGSLEVDVVPEEEQDVAVGDPIQQRGPGSGQVFVDEGPGSYFLDIISSGLDYTLTVEECAGGGGGGGGGTTGPNPPPPPTPPQPAPKITPEPAPPRPAPPNPQPQPEPPLMKAGAPSKGPVPTMPDGRCPKEYPLYNDSACYR